MKAKKIMMIVLCMAALSMTACGGKKPSANPELTSEESVMIANPWVDYTSVEEASKAIGYDVVVPDSITGFQKQMVQATSEGEKLLQVYYYNDEDLENSVLIRKGAGSEDVSGDYNEYAEVKEADIEGRTVKLSLNEDKKVCLAVWTEDGYSFSVSVPGMTEEEATAIIEQVK